jgi:very-short-patch-repair endonuclease
MTRAEIIFWQSVRGKRLGGFRFRRQHPIGIYIADFVCISQMLVVEIDGSTHFTEEQRAYDDRRRRYLESLGWRELRVSNGAVYVNLDGVLHDVLSALKGAARLLTNECAERG